MEEVGCGVFDEVVPGFLVANLAVERVDSPLIVSSPAPAGRVGAQFRDGQDELVLKGEVES